MTENNVEHEPPKLVEVEVKIGMSKDYQSCTTTHRWTIDQNMTNQEYNHWRDSAYHMALEECKEKLDNVLAAKEELFAEREARKSEKEAKPKPAFK